MARCSKPLSFA